MQVARCRQMDRGLMRSNTETGLSATRMPGGGVAIGMVCRAVSPRLLARGEGVVRMSRGKEDRTQGREFQEVLLYEKWAGS